MRAEKVCIICLEFYLSGYQPGYSEYTPSCHAKLGCKKHKFFASLDDLTEQDFRDLLLKADKCEFYNPVKG